MYADDPLGAGERMVRRMPHYAMQTVTTSAPEFANTEQDLIKQAFSAGNHTWMKEAVPVELAPDSVNLLRRQRMEKNRLMEPPSQPQSWSRMTQLWGGGYYPEFEYMPDEYERKDDFARAGRQIAQEKRDKISNHDWRVNTQEARLKHEAMIRDPRNKQTYPRLDGDRDNELPQALMKDLGFLRGRTSLRDWVGTTGTGKDRIESNASFLAGKGSGLEDDSRTSRMTLLTVVRRLQARLDADWEGCTAVVSATEQDLVQIAFHMATVDSERGVHAYMNVLSKDVDLLGEMGLRKVAQLWGLRRDFGGELGSDQGSEDGVDDASDHSWTFFLLAPKWVKMRATDAYYTAHPRSQGSEFRMSAAGNSVLLSLGAAMVGDTPGPQSARGHQSARGGRGPPSDASAVRPTLDINALERAVGSKAGGGDRLPPLSSR